MSSAAACYSSSHTIMASCVSSASLGLNPHSLQLKSSVKTSNPIFTKTPLQDFSDLSRPTISCSDSRKIKSKYSLTPSSKSWVKFRLIQCKSMKSPNGFGQVPEKRYKKKKIKTIELEENAQGDGMNAKIDEDDEIPEVVFNRIIKRIGFYVVGPMMTGFILFPFYDFLNSGLKVDVPTWIPIVTVFFTFGTSALGIMYGAVSASWDPAVEGSLLGWTEAQKNWPEIWKSDQGQSTD
ncbi:hypothetical protein SUGI_0013590 [Cryptomeria japonica]|nr:hypothetical protein SUGI_0013590 [Cryptomeria japonica]